VATRDEKKPPQIRPAFVPGVLGAVVAFSGTGLIGSDAFVIIRFGISILALIIAVFAWQGRKWLWLIPLGALAVLWNPVVPVPMEGRPWVLAHVAAAAVFLVVAFFLRVPAPDAEKPGRPGR
jgi:hypothetical protein